MIAVCSLGVPAHLRSSWRKEWIGELWQVRASCRSATELLHFAAGAFADAACLLLEARDDVAKQAVPASRCILVLTALVVVATATAWSLPRVRSEFRQMNWKSSADLTVLFLPNSNNEAAPTITPERFELWRKRAPYLQKLGFYQIADRELSFRGRTVKLGVAHMAGDMAMMVSPRGVIQQGTGGAVSGLVLSRSAWRRYFHADASIKGKTIRIDGHTVRVAGVADLEDSGLPGRYDAWLFDEAPLRASVPGFVIGIFAPSTAVNPYFGFEHFSVRESQEVEISGLAVPAADRKPNPWSTLGLGLALSLLALPATTPLGFGEKVRAGGRASPWQVLRRWFFASFKCLVWALLASDAALIIGALFPRADWRFAVTTRILVAFAGMLLGLRWSIHDQRRRCPVCLKQLTNPARVGEPSRSFLSWNGTELVCEGGHGLMHVPAHATSWFGTQRWLALDPSWQFLFAQKR